MRKVFLRLAHFVSFQSNVICFLFSVRPDDSPPSIRIKIGIGSGAFEPSGVLAVLPSSTIHLDCMYPRRRGIPEWTWTGWHRTYYTGKLDILRAIALEQKQHCRASILAVIWKFVN